MRWMGGRVRSRQRAANCLPALLALILLTALSACASGATSGKGRPASITLITSCPAAATSAPNDRLAHIACLAVRGLVGHIETTYDPQRQAAQVTATFVGTRVPRTDQQIGDAQEAVKTVCFRVQRALWTSGIALRQVTITVQGPILDDFFNVLTDWYGGSRLTAQTAGGLDWQAANADGAWGRYDQAWLRTAYVPNQYYSASPASTPLASQS